MTVVLEGKEGIVARLGQEIGPGPWIEVTQDRINRFAEAGGDFQWIHVDEERAKQGPYGATIAHGLLTLAMVNALTEGLLAFKGFRMAVNYGYEKVRFLTPVVVGTRLRARVKPLTCEEGSGGTVMTVVEITVEIEGKDKPACVAQMIFRHVI